MITAAETANDSPASDHGQKVNQVKRPQHVCQSVSLELQTHKGKLDQ